MCHDARSACKCLGDGILGICHEGKMAGICAAILLACLFSNFMIIQPTIGLFESHVVSVWFVNKTMFGISWKLVQVKILPSDKIAGFSFQEDSDEEEEEEEVVVGEEEYEA